MVQPNGTSWDKLEYAGQVGQGEGGLQILVGQVGQGEGGLQIFVGQVGQGQGVCPLEPFHLSQMGLQGRERFKIGLIKQSNTHKLNRLRFQNLVRLGWGFHLYTRTRTIPDRYQTLIFCNSDFSGSNLQGSDFDLFDF